MKRFSMTLILLSLMIIVSSGQDWLGGGYVGRSNNNEVSQYFADPLFYSSGNSRYLSDDPAVRQMQESLEYPINRRYLSDDPAIRQMQLSIEWPRRFQASESSLAEPAWGYGLANARLENVEGRWQLISTDDIFMDLTLYQSQNDVFGQGVITSGRETQWATVSGSIYGRNMELEITPADNNRLYTISLDVSRWPFYGTYTVYMIGASPRSGTFKANRLNA